jgi:hypothetical protein
MNFNLHKGGVSKTTSSVNLREVLDGSATEEDIQIVDVDSAPPRILPTYDSVAAYNKEAPGRELPGDADDIQHVFHNAIDDGRIEFCLDFAPSAWPQIQTRSATSSSGRGTATAQSSSWRSASHASRSTS